jgi:hypothetical protein
MKNERREFLKKVAYSAPVVVALGGLVEPTDAQAMQAMSKKDGRMAPKNCKSKIKSLKNQKIKKYF